MFETADAPALVLASGSPARRDLLARFDHPFTVDPADIDETPGADEPSRALASRLAREKAAAVATRHPASVIIGSDQVAECNGSRLLKPGNRERAIAQLAACSGHAATFWTAVCVMSHDDENHHAFIDRTVVRFRRLERAEIERYVDIDKPFACAGGFKAESVGIALFESIESTDPTALIGLPLIKLAATLSTLGIAII